MLGGGVMTPPLKEYNMALVTYLDGVKTKCTIAAGDATGAQDLRIDVSALAKNVAKCFMYL